MAAGKWLSLTHDGLMIRIHLQPCVLHLDFTFEELFNDDLPSNNFLFDSVDAFFTVSLIDALSNDDFINAFNFPSTWWRDVS